MIKNLAIALSLANLCLLRTWAELSHLSNYYFMKGSPSTQIAAFILNVLLLTAVFWFGATLIRWLTYTSATKLARWAFLLLLIIPLNGIRSQFLPLSTWGPTIGWTQFIFLCFVLGIATIFIILRWQHYVIHIAKIILLVLLPYAIINLFQATWLMVKNQSIVVNEKLAEPVSIREHSSPRVLWLMFDAMDQRIAFSERPQTVKLSELDRLRTQSLYASNAYSLDAATLYALPALLSGQPVEMALPTHAGELKITFKKTDEPVDWSTQPNLFSKALKEGFNTALLGWYHPYCRVIGFSLTACSSEEVFGSTAGSRTGTLSQIILAQLYNLWPWRSRQHHIKIYKNILKEAKEIVRNPSFGLMFVHFPIPHEPYIYNRIKNKFTLSNYFIDGYLDNLVLADRTLGELRQSMESANMWDNTTILLSADTSWQYSSYFDGKKDKRVPFLLKLAGQQEKVDYDSPFNIILTHDLILSLLRSEISSIKNLIEWIDQVRLKEKQIDKIQNS